MIPEGIIEAILHRLAFSVNSLLIDRDEGRLNRLPGLSTRLFSHIERDLRQQQETYRSRVIRFHATTFHLLPSPSVQTEFGADLVMVVNVDIQNFRINKGFLAQSILIPHAKMQGTYMVDPGLMDSEPDPPNPYSLKRPTIGFDVNGVISIILTPQELRELSAQCQRMLLVTPDCFVFLICEEDVYVIPASAVTALHYSESFYEFHCKNFHLFMAEYLRCFIGDERICAFSEHELRQLATDNHIDHALHLQILDLTMG